MTYARDIDQLQRLVDRQHGRITGGQLAHLGIARSTIHTWLVDGRLRRVLPKVYAIGHVAASREADLWAAILYAGPGAMLSHATAAHWRGLIDYAPSSIEVSTPRKIVSTAGVRVHGRRQLERHLHHQLSVTSIPQTMLDLAATTDLKLVRRALATLDYRKLLDLAELNAITATARPGSPLLRLALKTHQPQLARTNGRLEEEFLAFCEQNDLPIPRLNVSLHGITVDAHWPTHDLVVELDGYDNHSSPAQLRRDKRHDLTLRSHGLTVVRYDWALIHDQPHLVRDDLKRAQRSSPT